MSTAKLFLAAMAMAAVFFVGVNARVAAHYNNHEVSCHSQKYDGRNIYYKTLPGLGFVICYSTSFPGLFPEKMGGVLGGMGKGGKRPWHRLVTCTAYYMATIVRRLSVHFFYRKISLRN